MSYSIQTGHLVVGPYDQPDTYTMYEKFILTRNPDGTRTMRTITSEGSNHDVFRDVHQTVGADWRAIEGYDRLYVSDKHVGTIWRRITGDKLMSDLWLPSKELDTAEFPAPPNLVLGFHPVTADAWKFNFFDTSKGGNQPIYVHTVSPTPNGATLGHGLAIESSADYLGKKEVTVPAGTFEAEGFLWHSVIDTDLEVWRTGPDNLFVQLIVHDRNVLYQLGELTTVDSRDQPSVELPTQPRWASTERK